MAALPGRGPGDRSASSVVVGRGAGRQVIELRVVIRSTGQLTCEHLFMNSRTETVRDVWAVRRRRCPECSGRLTDPARSPLGYSHCRACRVGWRIEQSDLGEHVKSRAHDSVPPIVREDTYRISPGVRTIPDPRFEQPEE